MIFPLLISQTFQFLILPSHRETTVCEWDGIRRLFFLLSFPFLSQLETRLDFSLPLQREMPTENFRWTESWLHSLKISCPEDTTECVISCLPLILLLAEFFLLSLFLPFDILRFSLSLSCYNQRKLCGVCRCNSDTDRRRKRENQRENTDVDDDNFINVSSDERERRWKFSSFPVSLFVDWTILIVLLFFLFPFHPLIVFVCVCYTMILFPSLILYTLSIHNDFASNYDIKKTRHETTECIQRVCVSLHMITCTSALLSSWEGRGSFRTFVRSCQARRKKTRQNVIIVVVSIFQSAPKDGCLITGRVSLPYPGPSFPVSPIFVSM